MSHKELFEKSYVLADSVNVEVRKEALFIFTNILLTTTDDQTKLNLISAKDFKLLSLFCSALSGINDASILKEILLALEQIFGLDQKFNMLGE